jgi:pilus assembly protein Flp/PilA
LCLLCLFGYLRTFFLSSSRSTPAPFRKRDLSPSRETGQGQAEYALLLVMVAMVVLAMLTVLGPRIGNAFSRVTSDLVHVPGP